MLRPQSVRLTVVPQNLLEELAADAHHSPAHVPDGSGVGRYTSRLLVELWLKDCGVAFRVKREADGKGRTVYILRHCPFDPAHAAPDACVMQDAHGKMSAQCFHNSCKGRGWREFKEAIGTPEWHHYDLPLAKPHRQIEKQASHSSATPKDPTTGERDIALEEADDDPHRLANGFLQRFQTEQTLTLRYWREEFLRWDGRVYRTIAEPEIRAEATQYVRREFERLHRARRREGMHNGPASNGNQKPPPPVQKVTVKLMADVFQALRGIACLPFDVEQPAWLNDPEPFPAPEALVCANGILHLPSWAEGASNLHLLTPRLFSTAALDYRFDAAAATPNHWLHFLSLLWPDDPQAIAALQEWFGYCLLPDTSQQKIMMLVGPKRSGKGTIARVLSHLIGLHNVASPTLGNLGTPFGLEPLLYKTLAIVSDARLSHRTDAAIVVERLLSISGEDAQTVDRKYRGALTLKLPVRFLILTNELPKLHDPAGALVGRLILLRMTQSFYGREDTTMTATLLRELPGILLWAIEGWKRLRQRGRFEQPDSSINIMQQMDDLASPVAAFVRERCEVGPAFTAPCSHLFEAWKDWSEAKGMKSGSEQSFGRDLRAAVAGLDTRQQRCDGMRLRVYTGLRLRVEEAEDEGGETPWG